MTSPAAAGSAALPAVAAATCRLTIRVVCVTLAVPVRCAVVMISRGKTGAAARPTVTRPMTATAPGPGTDIIAAPRATPMTEAVSTRDEPARSATGPRTARPANIIAQYAATAVPAAAGDRPRPEVRKT
jgi:hypothetical protein